MVFLVERLGHSLKLSFRLDNHHHHFEASPEASLQVFRSKISNFLNQLSLNSKPESEYLSLIWIHQCFELLPGMNEAFMKLTVDLDYPMSKWEAVSTEEYFKYTLNLLNLLNSMSSALSRLGQTKVSLYHALGLVENSPSLAMENLRENESKICGKDFKDIELKGIEDSEEMHSSGKDWIIHQALSVMKNIGFWICGIVVSGLYSDSKPYMEMRKSVSLCVDSSLEGLDSCVCNEITKSRGMLKEFKEVNDAVARLVAAIGNGKGTKETAKELKKRLEVVENVLQGLEKELNLLFSKFLSGRDELLHSFRYKNNRKA